MHPTVTNTLLNAAKLDAIRRACARIDAADVPGDLAELGVYRGGVARALAERFPARTVRLFDTFTGIPWDGYDPDKDRHRPGEFACPMDLVKDLLAGLSNVSFHPGLFPGTAAGERFALVHLDADLYASTLAGLEWFWPRLSVGGCVVLDDWKWHYCPGVEIAVREFFSLRTDHQSEDSAGHQLTVWKCN
jgi:hypothetical protein